MTRVRTDLGRQPTGGHPGCRSTTGGAGPACCPALAVCGLLVAKGYRMHLGVQWATHQHHGIAKGGRRARHVHPLCGRGLGKAAGKVANGGKAVRNRTLMVITLTLEGKPCHKVASGGAVRGVRFGR